MQLVPAGVPRSLSRLKHRIGAVFADVPVLFIGLVIGIAVVFRLGIGAIKTASAEPEPPPVFTHERVSEPKTPAVTAAVEAEPVPAVTATTESEPKSTLPKKKPRLHGKR